MTTPSKPAVDMMICRVCGREERASEGYPCVKCGTFICLMCTFKGVVECRACSGGETPASETAP